jgi:hypothetical protein
LADKSFTPSFILILGLLHVIIDQVTLCKPIQRACWHEDHLHPIPI